MSELPLLRLWLRRCSACMFAMAGFVPVLLPLCLLVFLPVFLPSRGAHASETFPFGSELMLDAAPMHGSRRVPMIEIEDDGTASIDLWCASLKAQATVDASTISIVPGPAPAPPAQCDPDREARDADLLSALTQVTGWHRSGEVIELTGATPLRFHLMTN